MVRVPVLVVVLEFSWGVPPFCREARFGRSYYFIGEGRGSCMTLAAEMRDMGRARRRLESDPAWLAGGPQVVLHVILDEVTDQYMPVIAGVQNDLDEIEDQLFTTEGEVARRNYELSREVTELQRATQPLAPMLEALRAGAEKYGLDLELQRSLRDVQDHVLRVVERVNGFRVLLQNALTVHAALIGQRQNEEMRHLSESSLRQNEEVKKISSWAAILFAPMLIGTIYGMNFDHMPELEWALGYPFALALMVLMGMGLYLMFKRRNWL